MNIEDVRADFKQKLVNLTNELRSELLSLNCGFNENLYLRIRASEFEIGLAKEDNIDKPVWASEVKIYPANVGCFPLKKSVMSYPTSGTFNPQLNDNAGPTWRTLHAAAIIQNWDKISALAEQYSGSYIAIVDQFNDAVNKLN